MNQQTHMAIAHLHQTLRTATQKSDPVERGTAEAAFLVFEETLYTLDRIASALETIAQNTSAE